MSSTLKDSELNRGRRMRYLFEDLSPITQKIRIAPRVLLFLDYDGTLVAIRKRPEDAVLSPVKRRLLDSINERKMPVSIVTGRTMEDIRKLVGVKGLSYIANHGFEIWHRGRLWVQPEVGGLRPSLARAAQELETGLGTINGLMVESKGHTVSVHYRNVRGVTTADIRRRISDSIEHYGDSFRISQGKRVFEIRPNIDWDKGKAVLRLTELVYGSARPLKIYIGDDRTDEDAFRMLSERDITVLVGKRSKTFARYYVNNISEVTRFLKTLVT